MAKLSGQFLQILLDDAGGTQRDISRDVNSIDLPLEHAELDYTGFMHLVENQGAGILSLNIEMSGDVYPASPAGSHTVLAGIEGVNSGHTLTVRLGNNAAPTTGDPQLELEVICTKYGITATPKGKQQFTASLRPYDPDVAPKWGLVP